MENHTGSTVDQTTAEPNVPTRATPPIQAKPELVIPDSAAISLLEINNLQAGAHPQKKLPVKLLLIIIALVALAFIASAGVGAFKPKSNSNSASQAMPASSSSSDDTTKQVNQDVESCADPVTALTSC